MMTRSHNRYVDMMGLETSAMLAGRAWVCNYSSSDEYEQELISVRRAQGRYTRMRFMPMAWAGSALVAASVVFLML